VGTSTDWTAITSYGEHNLAIKSNGTLWSWGRGFRNVLGHNDQVDRSSPTQVGTNTNWSKIEVGFSHALAIKTDGTLWAWGSNGTGFLGTNNQTTILSPVQIGSSTWLDVACGVETSFAIKTDGTLWAWGNGSLGQLGLPGSLASLRRSSPVQVGTATDWGSTAWGGRIFSSGQATLLVKTNGTLWGWGVNLQGRLGTNNTNNVSSPVQIGALTNWSYPVISGPHQGNEAETAMAICTRTDGTIWSWGSNTFGGQGRNISGVGFGNSSNRTSSPVQIGTDTNWDQGHSKVAIGIYGHVSAVKTDGTLWLWGYNGYGTLGLNDKVYRSSPVQLGSGTTWRLVSAGDRSMMAQRLA
jgi:alpha-tubulin suppressor-like RCC1 family protein